MTCSYDRSQRAALQQAFMAGPGQSPQGGEADRRETAQPLTG